MEAGFLIFAKRPLSAEDSKENKDTPENAKSQSSDVMREGGDEASKAKQKDPWSLDLFEDIKSASATSLNSTSVTSTTRKNEQRSPAKPIAKFKFKEPKIVRSLSQPHVNANSRFGLFSLCQKTERKRPETVEDTQYASDFYLYTLVWACVIMLFWKNIMLLPILPIPILIYFFKHVGLYLGIWGVLNGYFQILKQHLRQWCIERVDALAPVPVRGLYKILKSINTSLKNSIKESIDTVSSCVVICALLVFFICASIFFVFQVNRDVFLIAFALMIYTFRYILKPLCLRRCSAMLLIKQLFIIRN